MQGLTNPGQKKGKRIWIDRFIDGSTHDSLSADKAQAFLQYRAESIEKWLTAQCEVNL